MVRHPKKDLTHFFNNIQIVDWLSFKFSEIKPHVVVNPAGKNPVVVYLFHFIVEHAIVVVILFTGALGNLVYDPPGGCFVAINLDYARMHEVNKKSLSSRSIII